ncbi:MAG: proline dehydrogenase family protein [Isosphaeraceae bacterium]|nr:proline dehydrogenase family protein [Isosphaeraceae bacterium]
MATAQVGRPDESADLPPSRSPVERRALAIGREIFERVGRGPKIWQRPWWDDRAMALAMSDPTVKVQLFRFIDVLPTLRSPAAVGRHLREYLEEAGDRVPWWMRWGVALAPPGTWAEAALASTARWSATHMARRFIAGETPDEASRTVMRLRGKQLAFTADLLGEAVITDGEAIAYQQTCLDLLRGLTPALERRTEVPLIDRDADGKIPRMNLSLKLTSLVARFDPIHAERTTEKVLERLRPILLEARRLGAFVNVDMEQYEYKDLTYAIFERVMMEEPFRSWADVGIVCQAYLLEAEADLRRLAEWARRRGTPVTIRLVKGAYWDFEVTHARQHGHPVPVFTRKWETDANYERCSTFLLENAQDLRPAFGSHNIRSIAHALAVSERLGLARGAVEIQMLNGMGESIQEALVGMGLRVRLYTPYGAILPGMAYLVRRLLENTSNDSFLKAGFTDHAAVDKLLENPEETGIVWRKRSTTNPAAKPVPALTPFRNEPPTDFHFECTRDSFRESLERVRDQMPIAIPLWIDGVARAPKQPGNRAESRDPGNRDRLVGFVDEAGLDDVAVAVDSARRAFPIWSKTSAEERARVLLLAASIFRAKRFDLAAWQVYECGKPWREADADIAEAIDFCEFYAREMIRLSSEDERDVPGETNRIGRIARGVVVVIPPWNFPLAIPTGMTVAALVAGNTVILKPAEQSIVTAWMLVSVLNEAGLPPGVLNFLPGRGEIVGQALVDDPRIDLISFTGSRAVGLEINRRASVTPVGQDHVKRVIAEMGGKNALIIDDDADLDEAVVGTLQSAFGYAGQKCSACSRVIVLDAVYDKFVERLVDAAHSIPVGHADDPETFVGPVIEAAAAERLAAAVERAVGEGARIAFSSSLGDLASRGSFFPPHILTGVQPDHFLAREELFGPVLAVMRAASLEEALEIAGGTSYALTGGLYSRSPAHIDRVKREFRVGNLYINRSITGALVDRQPFGGFKLSGIGTKAGGSDYLREFLLTRVCTENTMRRGFAPEEVERVESSAIG